ncbi:MAG TPA: tetratricopeptide repeat protein [Sphingomicrobium sp.]|nr:tetratricopeptide repeat protein [Sphingomicrobium sp.]
MKSRLITALAVSAAMALVPSLALAQRQAPPTPEQRIDRLERQVQQVQRQLFPKGRPADTAGFSDDPAATQSSVVTLDQRLDALEKQMADLVRMSEENGNRLRGVETGLSQLKADEDQRISAIEQKMSQTILQPPAPAPAAEAPMPSGVPAKSRPGQKPVPPNKTAEAQPLAEGGPEVAGASVPATDPGEDAYTQGFRLWEAGQYDQAISSLKSFTAAYPRHRRVSFANNLIGRALLDKGDPRAAAQALLTNYRSNPGGERAQDSLYYLGQALMKLGQPGQACKAYAELDAVYGAKVRPDLKKLETDGKAQAQCS